MPVNRYFGGSGEKVMSNMQGEYGADKGKRVFYATANKQRPTKVRPKKRKKVRAKKRSPFNQTGPKPPLGSGQRFAQVAQSAAASGARDPNAVAAAAGRQKFGKKRFQQLAQKGKPGY